MERVSLTRARLGSTYALLLLGFLEAVITVSAQDECTETFQRCQGADGFPFVSFADCCDNSFVCVVPGDTAGIDELFGSFCVPVDNQVLGVENNDEDEGNGQVGVEPDGGQEDDGQEVDGGVDDQGDDGGQEDSGTSGGPPNNSGDVEEGSEEGGVPGGDVDADMGDDQSPNRTSGANNNSGLSRTGRVAVAAGVGGGFLIIGLIMIGWCCCCGPMAAPRVAAEKDGSDMDVSIRRESPRRRQWWKRRSRLVEDDMGVDDMSMDDMTASDFEEEEKVIISVNTDFSEEPPSLV